MTDKKRPGADPDVEREVPQKERSLADELRPGVKRKQWVAQRIIWGVIALIIGLALAGTFGGGPLSKVEARASLAEGEVKVDYSRFGRQKAPQQMDIRVTTASAAPDQFRLIVPQESQSTIRIDQVTPSPESVELTADGAVYAWPVSGPGEFLVTVRFEALQWRRIEMSLGVQVGLTQASTLELEQWVYP